MSRTTWADTAAQWGSPIATWADEQQPAQSVPSIALHRHVDSGVLLLSHPFRLDPAGRVSTVVQGSARHAAEAAGHVLSCLPGERPLAPEYGFDEPIGATDVEPDALAATIVACEPDLQPESVDVAPDVDGHVRIIADVSWAI